MPVRYDMFGFSNYTGLFAALLLLALAGDLQRRLAAQAGHTGLEGLQRWNYACFGLTALHTFGYLLGIQGLKPAFVATSGALRRDHSRAAVSELAPPRAI